MLVCFYEWGLKYWFKLDWMVYVYNTVFNTCFENAFCRPKSKRMLSLRNVSLVHTKNI